MPTEPSTLLTVPGWVLPTGGLLLVTDTTCIHYRLTVTGLSLMPSAFQPFSSQSLTPVLSYRYSERRGRG